MIAGIANDSNVCTAPVFWGMLGLGLAVNRMLVEKENLFVVKETVSAESDTAVKQSNFQEESANPAHRQTSKAYSRGISDF